MTKRIIHFDMIVEFERARDTTNSPNSCTEHTQRNRTWNSLRESHICCASIYVFVAIVYVVYAMRYGAERVRARVCECEWRLALINKIIHISHFGVEFELRLKFFFVFVVVAAAAACWIRVRTTHIHSQATERRHSNTKGIARRSKWERDTSIGSRAEQYWLPQTHSHTMLRIANQYWLNWLAHSCARVLAVVGRRCGFYRSCAICWCLNYYFRPLIRYERWHLTCFGCGE